LKKKPPKPPPERSLYERLRDHALEPPSSQDLAEIRKRQAELKSLEEGRRELDRANAIRDNLRPPPWIKQQPQEDEDGPMVRRAKELMAAKFPDGEWAEMGPRAVRFACESLAKERGVKLPGVDSFARVMGRRKKPYSP
jgi:hypothetical protein